MLTTNGIYTFANVVIYDLTHVNLFSWIVFSLGIATTITTQANVVLNCDQHPKDDFIPLTIEIFGCLQ